MDQKLLGRSREGINGQICRKCGIRIAWMNPLGCFIYFLKILIFGPWGPSPGS